MPLASLRAALDANDETAWTIVFEEIVLALRIGAYPSEKHAPQRVSISAEILVVPAAPLAGDDLSLVVDYDAVHREILGLTAEAHVALQETLAERVARICLRPKGVAAVDVHVRKLDAYPDCRSVGIRIVRTSRDGQA